MRNLSLSILDLVQNSVRSGASVIEITITDSDSENRLSISVKDNSHGIEHSEVIKVTDPFFTTCKSHKVGLGIPFFVRRAILTGGDYCIESQKGSGFNVSAWFNKLSVDCVPLGDISSVIQCLIISAPDIDLVFSYKSDWVCFGFDTRLFHDELGLEHDAPPALKAAMIKEYLANEIIQ